MKKAELCELIDKGYNAVQSLQLQPTKGNVMMLGDIMAALEQCYKYAQETGDDEEGEKADV